MIQQTLLQSYDNIRKKSHSLGESTSDRNLVNGAKVTDFKINYIQFAKEKRGYPVDRSKWQKEKSEQSHVNDNVA